ncbi:MAG: hypothetical protein ABSG82_00810 [Sedimentisphaerales bacterium]
MSKSQIRTLMCVLCLTALCAIIVGCESQATCPTKAKAAAKEPNATCEKAKATTEKPKEAVAKTKESAGEKGATMGPYNLTANWTDDQGFINSWIIVGPFPNPGTRPDCNGFNVDYLKNYGSELNIVPTNGMEIKKDDGTVVKWEQYKATATDISFFDVPHLKLEPQQTNVLCYAACWLDCDADNGPGNLEGQIKQRQEPHPAQGDTGLGRLSVYTSRGWRRRQGSARHHGLELNIRLTEYPASRFAKPTGGFFFASRNFTRQAADNRLKYRPLCS